MASLTAISKARIYSSGMKAVFGVEPDLDIQSEYVRLYYTPDKLQKAQSNFNKIMTAEPGEVRAEIAPVITPFVLKKAAIPALGLFLFGYLLAKQI